MKIAFAATPLSGHLNPLLSIAMSAKARGDEVVVTTGTALASVVRNAGVRFVPLEGEADLGRGRLDDIARERDALPFGAAQFCYDFEKVFLDPMPAQAATLHALIARERPDALVVDAAFTGVLPFFRRPLRQRPAIIMCGISFLMLDRPDSAPLGFGLPPARTQSDRQRYAAMAEANAGYFEELRRRTNRQLAAMGLSSLPGSVTQALVSHCDAYLMLTVPEFEYDFESLPEHVHFVGMMPAPASHAPLPDWWNDFFAGRKVVLVTQGTVANCDLGQLIEPTLTALSGRQDLLVVAATGRPLIGAHLPVSSNGRAAAFLPYDRLMQKLDLLVTNGGYGTVSLALASGVPVVVSGVTEDKAEVGARVAWSGAGLTLGRNRPTSAEILAAVDEVLVAPRYRERARRLAASAAGLDTMRKVLSIIDSVCGRTLREPSSAPADRN